MGEDQAINLCFSVIALWWYFIIQRKESSTPPINAKHSAEFARLLMGILPLKQLVLHNYDKFNLILGEKYEQELDYLQFNDNTDLTYREDRIDGESTKSYEKQFDNDGHDVQKIKELVVLGDDIKEYKDWEDLLLHDRVKRIRV